MSGVAWSFRLLTNQTGLAAASCNSSYRSGTSERMEEAEVERKLNIIALVAVSFPSNETS